MALTCGRTKLGNVDEHLHVCLLANLAEALLTCVFPAGRGCGELLILAVRSGPMRAVAVLMPTACRVS